MCLLIQHTPDTRFDKADLADFYAHNKDGMGVMYLHEGAVVVHKALPKSAEEAWEFYTRHAQGRDCAVHLRQRTHGDIDLEHNCHPYEIMPGYYLMHNGVLHTGNKADPTKSDTYLFCRDYLRPQLEANPRLIKVEAWQAFLGEFIGSGNRFVLMTPEGAVSINMPDIEYKGAQMSNTYAWSAPMSTYKPTSNLATSPLWWGEYGYEDPVGADDYVPADEAIEYLFDVLDDCAYWETYNALHYADAEALYDKLGEEGFNFFVSTLYESGLRDHEVLHLIRNPDEANEHLYGAEERAA